MHIETKRVLRAIINELQIKNVVVSYGKDNIYLSYNRYCVKSNEWVHDIRRSKHRICSIEYNNNTVKVLSHDDYKYTNFELADPEFQSKISEYLENIVRIRKLVLVSQFEDLFHIIKKQLEWI